MRAERMRVVFRLLIDGKSHRFGHGNKTVCGLPTDYATEAPLQTRWCPECRVGAVEALELKLQAALLRATNAEAEAEHIRAVAQAGELALMAKMRTRETAQRRAEGARKTAERAVLTLTEENAGLRKAARMWRAIVEGEDVLPGGSDEDYLLVRPVPEPRFVK